jgi:hypothetical protein
MPYILHTNSFKIDIDLNIHCSQSHSYGVPVDKAIKSINREETKISMKCFSCLGDKSYAPMRYIFWFDNNICRKIR